MSEQKREIKIVTGTEGYLMLAREIKLTVYDQQLVYLREKEVITKERFEQLKTMLRSQDEEIGKLVRNIIDSLHSKLNEVD